MAVVRMRYLVIKSYFVPSHQNRQLGPAGARRIHTMEDLAYVHHSSFLAPISKSKITHTTPKNVSKLHKTHISHSYHGISVMLRRKTNRCLKNRNVWTRRLIFPTRKDVHENVFPGFKKSVWIITTKQTLQSVNIQYWTNCENLVYIKIYSGSDKIYIFRC